MRTKEAQILTCNHAAKKDKMIARKAYQDLTVADFVGMTSDQIRDVLESYKEEEERRRYQQMKLNERVANSFRP